MGFVEFCGLTLLNKLFARGVPTYEIPKQRRSIIDFGLTNALKTVRNFKVLQLNLGVTPQTCHRVVELSIDVVLKPDERKVPGYQLFNRPGKKRKNI